MDGQVLLVRILWSAVSWDEIEDILTTVFVLGTYNVVIGEVVCLLAANCGSSCLLRWAVDGRIVRCGITVSYTHLTLPTKRIV